MISTLGAEVLAAIAQQGLTNKAAASIVGITPQYLIDIKLNRRTPSDGVLDRLIKHLNLNRNYAYYLVNRYPPEIRNSDVAFVVLDKAINWITHPNDFALRKTAK